MVHCMLILGMIWLHNQPIDLIIAPGCSGNPIMCVEDPAVVIKEAKKAAPIKSPPPVVKKNALKEPVEKKKIQPKKVEAKKPPVKKVVEKKKELPKPVVKEIKPKPIEPVKKSVEPIAAKNEILTIPMNQTADTAIGSEVYGAVQSSWNPPVGIVPTKACVICIKVKNDGTVNTIAIEQSSGIPAYDMAAKAAVFKTQFPRQLWNRSVRFSFI